MGILEKEEETERGMPISIRCDLDKALPETEGSEGDCLGERDGAAVSYWDIWNRKEQVR